LKRVAPSAIYNLMTEQNEPARIFKTGWFAKAARKARIQDTELCKAIVAVMKGQADDLGGIVYKKRLDQNRYRSIVLAKGGPYWIFAYLFAKKDRDNITDEELQDFRTLAKAYASIDDDKIQLLLNDKDLMEICNDNKDSKDKI
jgi:hypothetical protein